MKTISVLVLCFIAAICATPQQKHHAITAKFHPHPFIIGGDVARAGQYPFSAAIYTTTPTGTYFCGGTLLNNEWVITTAFCLTDVTQFVIELGSTKLGSSDPNKIRVATDNKVIHPKYNPITLQNNIGLIKFRMPITFTEYIKPVDFLPVVQLPPSSAAQSVGWGQTNDDDGISSDLRWVSVSALSNEECKLTYGAQITDEMLCAEGNYNEGPCNGDIGGPLVQSVSRGHFVLVGLASFLSNNGCDSTDPSGFTRVFPYVEWITNTTTSA